MYNRERSRKMTGILQTELKRQRMFKRWRAECEIWSVPPAGRRFSGIGESCVWSGVVEVEARDQEAARRLASRTVAERPERKPGTYVAVRRIDGIGDWLHGEEPQ